MDLYHYTWFECVSSYGADLADKTFLGLQKFDDNIRTYYQFDSGDATRFFNRLIQVNKSCSISIYVLWGNVNMSINLIKPTRLTTCFMYFFSVRVVFCLKFITITQVHRDLVRVRSRVNAATLRYDRRRN